MQKPFYKSKTFWGAALIIVNALAKHYGYVLPAPDLIDAAGAGFAIWGIRNAVGRVEKKK